MKESPGFLKYNESSKEHLEMSKILHFPATKQSMSN